MTRTLVTGGSGLVGKHLRRLMPDATYVSSTDCDLTRPGQVDRLLSQGWDRVVHLPARVGGILDNKARPTAYLEENLLMNTYFVRRCREVGVKRFTAMLSSCIYPADCSVFPMDEAVMHDGPPCRSNYGYAVAKRVLATQVDLSNAEDPSRKWNYLIACNLYGEGDKDDPLKSHYVTALVRKIAEARASGSGKVVLLGDGTPRRQFMHAGDLARVIRRMVDEDVTESFNVCVDDNPTVEEIARAALKATGSTDLALEFTGDPSQNGEHRKDISNARMRAIMPGFSFTPLEEGIKAVYERYVNDAEQR